MPNNMTWSYLDGIRLHKGIEGCRRAFYEEGRHRPQRAAEYINDSRLQFPSLFILLPELEEFALFPSLNERNLVALKLCAKILKNPRLQRHVGELAAAENEMAQPVLLWMLKTGYKADGMSNPYDEIMDGAAALLSRTYKDQTALPIIAELLFLRNRKGAYLHDLAWALFAGRDPYALKLVADRLRAPEPKDVELAARLLNFVPANESNTPQARAAAYQAWIDSNAPFLQFTGDGFQLGTEPRACAVNLGAKYLGKAVSHRTGEPLEALTQEEWNQLESFRNMRDAEKQLLSTYSHRMREKNRAAWKQWMGEPVTAQVLAAQNSAGGTRWL